MEEEEVDLEEEEFEEVESESGGNRPDMRIVQPDTDQDGETIYNNVGAIWKNVSQNGNEYWSVKIGDLRLLAFPNK